STPSRTRGWGSSTPSTTPSWASRRWAPARTSRMRKTRRCGACWGWCGGARGRAGDRGRPTPRAGPESPAAGRRGRCRWGVGARVGPLAQGAAVGDPTLVEVVGRDGHGDDVTRQDADEVLADLARDVGDDLVPALQAHPELRVGQGGDDLALDLDGIFFRHA